MQSMSVTPQQVERRLLELSKEIEELQQDLEAAEHNYYAKKANYEIAIAKERLKISAEPVKRTAQEKEDLALVNVSNSHVALASAEATVKALRGRAVQIKTQVDIARSIGTSVRTSIDI